MRSENWNENQCVFRPLMNAQKLDPGPPRPALRFENKRAGVDGLKADPDRRRRSDRQAPIGQRPDRKIGLFVADVVEPLFPESLHQALGFGRGREIFGVGRSEPAVEETQVFRDPPHISLVASGR